MGTKVDERKTKYAYDASEVVTMAICFDRSPTAVVKIKTTLTKAVKTQRRQKSPYMVQSRD